MKKIFTLIGLLLCAALLSSCSSKTTNTEPEEDSSSQEMIELTLWTFPVGNWGHPPP